MIAVPTLVTKSSVSRLFAFLNVGTSSSARAAAPSMSIDSIHTLLAVLRRTMLLAPEQADEVARELAPHYADPEALGEYLVEIDWLTAFQLQLLLAGAWDELTVGPYQIL